VHASPADETGEIFMSADANGRPISRVEMKRREEEASKQMGSDPSAIRELSALSRGVSLGSTSSNSELSVFMGVDPKYVPKLRFSVSANRTIEITGFKLDPK